MNRADLYDALPDGLQKAIRAYEPLEAKSISELHEMLEELRYKFDLAPWHPLTAYVKDVARGNVTGRKRTHETSWVFNGRSKDKCPNEKAAWVILCITVQREGEIRRTRVAVCPKANYIWSYQTETQITKPYVYFKDGKQYLPISSLWTLEKANIAIRETAKDDKHGVVDVSYVVGSAELRCRGKQKYPNAKLAQQSKRMPDLRFQLDNKETETVTEPKAAQVVIEQVTDADKEMLLTMLEIASIRLKELGMFSTLNRWRSAVRRLTNKEINENDKTEPARSSDHLSGTT